jgi:hypothetical protein
MLQPPPRRRQAVQYVRRTWGHCISIYEAILKSEDDITSTGCPIVPKISNSLKTFLRTLTDDREQTKRTAACTDWIFYDVEMKPRCTDLFFPILKFHAIFSDFPHPRLISIAEIIMYLFCNSFRRPKTKDIKLKPLIGWSLTTSSF